MAATATETCCARIFSMPTWAPRYGDRCGAAAVAVVDVERGQPALLVCHIHERMLVLAAERGYAHELARQWAS